MEGHASFGYWLRRRRKALDLTQEELARRVGCVPGTIKSIEADARRPSKQLAERLAAVLELAPEERDAFLKAARAELVPDWLPPVATPPPLVRGAQTSTTQATETAPAVDQPGLPSGTVTFLFTDIEGSTRLWEQHPQLMQDALARHDAILRQAIAAQAGVVYNVIGDAFQAAFTTAPAACATALAAQHGLAHEAWGLVGAVPVRMALHTCTAVPSEGDYRTGALNRLGRLLGAIHGGQIVLSQSTADLAREMLPPNVKLRDLGEHHLRDLSPEPVFQLLVPDLPNDFPPLKTLDRPRHNLPAQPNVLIGRAHEVAAARERLLRDDLRLLTLTGPGGTGKTRLALQIAAELLDDFTHGVCFVPLASIHDPTRVVRDIAQALGIKETGAQSLIASLNHELHDKQKLLLLDNFEQVLDAAPVVAELLADCPGLKALITSRAPLHVYAEHEFPVPPLALPPRPPHPAAASPTMRERDPLPLRSLAWERPALSVVEAGLRGEGDPTQYAAVALFIARAQAVKPDFQVTNANVLTVVEICHRLDGLPLSIELAAARCKLFPPEALLARLSHRLMLLTGGPRERTARQQTLRGAIGWSYDLLDKGEQILFRRLAVFEGSFTLNAAETVCGGWDSGVGSWGADAAAPAPISQPPTSILNGLVALADNSLLREDEGPDDEPYFTMLETIREYALERLAASGEAEQLQQQHAAYYVALAEQVERGLAGQQQALWLARLKIEHDNLRAALHWAIQRGEEQVATRLSGVLWQFWTGS
jgi:predicted ATPase/class 3 adenylate cyclase